MPTLRSVARRLARDQIVQAFNDEYHLGHTPDGHRIFDTTSWLGVSIQKAPTDMIVVQEILHRTRPDVVVETGVWHGGSALYMATILDAIGAGQVIAVDITLDRLDPRAKAHPRCTFVEGSSTDPLILDTLREQLAERRVMVVLDSDHSERHVARELDAYAGLVSPGCYLIVEDTNIRTTGDDPTFGGGPAGALDKWLPRHPEFVQDRDAERLMLTFNPGGFLKRTA